MAALELKSVQGTSIRFDALRKAQRDELPEAAARGAMAGVLVEFRKDPHEVIFIPIDGWINREKESEKKSMNRNECRELGTVVPGTKRISRYRYDTLALLKAGL